MVKLRWSTIPSYIVYSKCLKTRCTGTCAWKRNSYSYKECLLTWKTIRKSCFWVLWAFSNFSVSSSTCCCFLSNSSSRLGSGFDSPFASPGWKQQSKLLHYQETVGLILEVTLLPRDCWTDPGGYLTTKRLLWADPRGYLTNGTRHWLFSFALLLWSTISQELVIECHFPSKELSRIQGNHDAPVNYVITYRNISFIIGTIKKPCTSSCRGADVCTDYHLVTARARLKLRGSRGNHPAEASTPTFYSTRLLFVCAILFWRIFTSGVTTALTCFLAFSSNFVSFSLTSCTSLNTCS